MMATYVGATALGVIGAVLGVLPESTRAALFADAPAPPDGFAADYLLLAINVVLLWIAVFQTWRLGRRLFDGPVGAIAALALLLAGCQVSLPSAGSTEEPGGAVVVVPTAAHPEASLVPGVERRCADSLRA